MAEAQVGLLYTDDIPEDYFADFIDEVREAGGRLEVETRENEPLAVLEWAVLTVVAIYLMKPFIDAFLRRAADDVADAVYPTVKAAVTRLAKKILIHQRPRITVVSSALNKVTDPSALVFAIYSYTKTEKRLKFVYNETLTELECGESVEQAFAVLQQHHGAIGDSEVLSEQIAKLQSPCAREIYLLYDKEANAWVVADPMEMARERHRKQSENSR